MEYLGIQIHDKAPGYVDAFSQTLLEGHYLKDGESVPQAYARAATAFCYGDYALAQRVYDYAYNGWFMFASPVLSNAPKGKWVEDEDKDGAHYWYHHTFVPEGKIDGMPISCFAMSIPDTARGQVEAVQELASLSMAGGGLGAHNMIRGTSKKAPGPIPYMKMMDSAIGYFKQKGSRRGALAFYLDVDHPDIMEHIQFRVPGGDAKRRSDNRTQFHSAVNLTDAFIEAVEKDQEYDLKCPHSGKVYDTLRARAVWEEIIETRALTGEPYLMKIDLANRMMPESQKRMGLKVHGSNLCVRGSTVVLTDAGDRRIDSMVGEKVRVWNGDEWSEVTPAITGENQRLVRVTLKSGKELDCTFYHRFYLYGDEDTPTPAIDLRPGDVLEEWIGPDDCAVFGEVASVKLIPGLHRTYCFTEPKRHRGVFNGILTGQCSEITLPTDEDRTFVCCLSSLNIEKFDEWKDSRIVEDLTRFLDNVLQFFIDFAGPGMEKAVYSAERERALGLGTLGVHAYLQAKSIPFESGGFNSAVQVMNQVYGLISSRADAESRALAVERGEAPDMTGTGRRNSRLMAIAPNANSADLLRTSPSAEPWYRNVFVKDTRAGSFTVRNANLEDVLARYGKNTPETWARIQSDNGSVQGLEFLTAHEKAVYKTATEIDQRWVIELADQRGKYVDQAQSTNVFFTAGMSREYVNSVHLKFLRSPHVVTMYYMRMEREVKVDSARTIERQALADWKGEDCVACQG